MHGPGRATSLEVEGEGSLEAREMGDDAAAVGDQRARRGRSVGAAEQGEEDDAAAEFSGEPCSCHCGRPAQWWWRPAARPLLLYFHCSRRARLSFSNFSVCWFVRWFVCPHACVFLALP